MPSAQFPGRANDKEQDHKAAPACEMSSSQAFVRVRPALGSKPRCHDVDARRHQASVNLVIRGRSGTCSRTGCLMSMIFSTPCVGCWRYSPIYMPSERSKGPGLVDYCCRPSRGQKR